MRTYIAPILCVLLLATAGCRHRPPRPPKRVRTTPPQVTFQVVNETLALPAPVAFETGSDKLRSESDTVLEVVLDYMTAKQEVTLVRIEGHTDSDGNAASNQSLSEKRAMSVAHWLVAQGVDCKRILPVGFGQTKPVAPNDTADNKAQNRRVAFINAAVRGVPLGGRPSDGGGKIAGDPCE